MSRSKYIVSKISFALTTVIAVVIFNFFLFRILPGDPVRLIVQSPRMTAEAQQRIRRQFGLDKPIWFDSQRLQKGDVLGAFDTQFTAYLQNLLRGNFGVSFASREDVGNLLAERVWRTIVLLLAGEILAMILGIGIGIIAAWRHGSVFDASAMLLGIFGWAMPTFFLCILLIILARGHLPAGGMVTVGLKPEDGLKYWADVGKHIILPTIAMVIIFTSQYMLTMRASTMEVLAEDYILTAKAKGLTTLQILGDHVLKNAMLPMVTVLTVRLGFVVGGAIQVETVFAWPGIGRLIYDAVARNDFPVLQGAFMLIALSVILANLLADLLYSVIDPRVQAE
jgi:peptide/nickel transport system permease protein